MSNDEVVYKDLIARGKKVETAKQWRRVIGRFELCCGVKDSYERSDVIKFIGELREAGMKQSSVNVFLRVLRLLCVIQKWEDGFPNLPMPKVRRCDVSRPMLSLEEIGILIVKAKEVCSKRELAFLAVATTYGLRREEIGTLRVYDGVVRVDTLKGGEVTVQLVPGAIKDIIKDYRGTSDVRYMSRAFQKIMRKVGLELASGYGWHSIRRALATELLLRDVSLWNILRFMRWSDASLQRELGMLVVYAKKEQAKVDEDVFKVHPFLRFWKLENNKEVLNERL